MSILGFGRVHVADVLRRENARLRRRLQKIATERAKIRDTTIRISAGMSVGVEADSMEGLFDRLRTQTAHREQLALLEKIARAEAELEAESRRLEEDIERMEQKLQEPLTLNLLAPTAGQEVNQGATLDIKWESTGPVGDRVKIGPFKRGYISQKYLFRCPD